MCQADVPSERHNANGDSIVIMITYTLYIHRRFRYLSLAATREPRIVHLSPSQIGLWLYHGWTFHHARDPCAHDGMEHILSIL
jgi:hypothetical protein